VAVTKGTIMRFVSKDPIRPDWMGHRVEVLGFAGADYIKIKILTAPEKAKGRLNTEAEVSIRYLEVVPAETNEDALTLLNKDD
jgi:hypothetical protein